jgi:hypothetical protein
MEGDFSKKAKLSPNITLFSPLLTFLLILMNLKLGKTTPHFWHSVQLKVQNQYSYQFQFQ